MSGCVKCGGTMKEGFIVDEGYGVVGVSTFQPGEPRRSFWSGIKQDKKNQIAITTMRCDRCGYLESFARTDR